jgi:hypothetical protein
VAVGAVLLLQTVLLRRHRHTIDHDHLDHLLVSATVRVGGGCGVGLRAMETERETKDLYIYTYINLSVSFKSQNGIMTLIASKRDEIFSSLSSSYEEHFQKACWELGKAKSIPYILFTEFHKGNKPD